MNARLVRQRPIHKKLLTEERQSDPTLEQKPSAQSLSTAMPKVATRYLHGAAKTYLGIDGNSTGRTPRQRLTGFAHGSSVSVDDLLAAIEGTVYQSNLPDCDEVVRLFDDEKVNLLVLPFMAGLHSLEQSGRLSVGDLNDRQIRLAVATLYTLPQLLVDPDSVDDRGIYRPEWFRGLLRDDPELVCDVLCRTATEKLTTSVQQPMELHEMACATDHAAVAKLAAVRVLDCFPKAATEVALRALCWSLRAALAQCDWEEVERVVGERLDQGGLTAAERVCWVVAGYVIKPRRYREDCRSLKTDDDGLRWLTEFLSVRKLRLGSTRHFSPKDVVLFVGAAGAAYRKHGLSADAHWSIADAITALSKNPSMAASEALDILIEERDAEPWIPAITSAVDLQARSRREKEFEHCDIGQVVRTLDAGSPANSGDLAALVFDQLSEISEKTRGGSTTDWRQHWNVDKYNRPERPKPETRAVMRSCQTCRTVWNVWVSMRNRKASTLMTRGRTSGSIVPASVSPWR